MRFAYNIYVNSTQKEGIILANIKELRSRTGLSQSKFAAKFGIPVQTLQGWESGRYEPAAYLINIIERDILQEEQLSNSVIVGFAEWLPYENGTDEGFHYCSNCRHQAFNYQEGSSVVEVESHHCPNCGFKMKKSWE